MIKNILNIALRLTLIVAIIIPSVFYPFTIASAAEAKNIKELKQKLAELKQEKIDTENSKKMTQSELNSKKNQSYVAYQDKTTTEKEIAQAEQDIEESNKEIERVTEETNELLRLLQQINGENAYLKFLAQSQSMTELLINSAIIEQISIDNQESIHNLKNLIQTNKELKVALEEKKVELESKIKTLASNISSLNARMAEFNELNEDINSQIKNQETVIKYYQDICTSDTQSLSTCIEKNGSLISAAGWLKPLTKGRITSAFGFRTNPITGEPETFHNAIDIAGNDEGTPVYASAAGQVIAITNGKAAWQSTGKKQCGGNIVYVIHVVNGKKYTTQYAHLLTINSSLSVGSIVTAYTQIGTQGGGPKTSSWESCSTGPHLHYGVATGHYLKDYNKWGTYIASAVQPPGYPAKGVWWYVR